MLFTRCNLFDIVVLIVLTGGLIFLGSLPPSLLGSGTSCGPEAGLGGFLPFMKKWDPSPSPRNRRYPNPRLLMPLHTCMYWISYICFGLCWNLVIHETRNSPMITVLLPLKPFRFLFLSALTLPHIVLLLSDDKKPCHTTIPPFWH